MMSFQSTLQLLLVLLPWAIMAQMPYPHPGQYGPSLNADYFQQQQIYSPQQQSQQGGFNQQQNQQQQQQQQPQKTINNEQQQQSMFNQQQQQQPPQQPQQKTMINQQQPQQPMFNQQQQLQQTMFNQQQQPSSNHQPSPIDEQQRQVQNNQGSESRPHSSFNQQYQQPVFGQQQQQQQPNVDSSFQQQQQQQQQLPSQIFPQQQPFYQGNMVEPPVQSYPFMPQNPNIAQSNLPNQYYLPNNNKPSIDNFPSTGGGSVQRYLVGNLSQPLSFKLFDPPRKVMHWSLNGVSIYINSMDLFDKLKFAYDEQSNLLTILSLDRTTVGSYIAVDSNWQTATIIVNAIDISSMEILNFRANEDETNGSLVSCKVTVIRSTFKLSENAASIPVETQKMGMFPPNPFPTFMERTPTNSNGLENLPRLDISISTRQIQSVLPNAVLSNDIVNNELVTRMITMQRPLTRADHNGTIRCQVESNNNRDTFLVKSVNVDMEYGPELETGAFPTVHLENEALQMINMDCQIDGNPVPSYIWYEMPSSNTSGDMMSYYGQQNQFGSYPSRQGPSISSAGLSVFGTSKRIQRLYQTPGRYSMQCQAQSRGKIKKQDFDILVQPPTGSSRDYFKSDSPSEKSNRMGMIIGIVVGVVVFLLIIALVIAGIIFMNRRKKNDDYKHTNEKGDSLRNVTTKNRNNHSGNFRSDQKYRQEGSKEDSSSRSHLVESAENSSNQGVSITTRTSPTTSRNPSYRQPTGSSQFSYVPAASGSGFRPISQQRSYSPDPDELDAEINNVHVTPFVNNRSKTSTPFGSHKSLTESIHSLRSNQQKPVRLPTKSRTDEPPPLPAPLIPKRDQRSPAVDHDDYKRESEHHHYHNPAQLRLQQQQQQQRQTNTRRNSSDEEDENVVQSLNDATEDSAFIPERKTFRVPAKPDKPRSAYNIIDKQQSNMKNQSIAPALPPSLNTYTNNRRSGTPPPSQKIALHQPTGHHHDEFPPSYHQVAKPSPSQMAHIFQDPTEV